MEYTILSEQVAIQEYIKNKRLAEPLLNVVWQSNKYHVSELNNEIWKKQWCTCIYEWTSQQLRGK